MEQHKNKAVFWFGCALTVLLSVLTFRQWVRHGFTALAIVLLSGALIMAVLTTFRREWLAPVFARWKVVGEAVLAVIATGAFAIAFYLTFAPVGIILRVIGKDLLNQKIRPDLPTYWVVKKPKGEDPARYTQQF